MPMFSVAPRQAEAPAVPPVEAAVPSPAPGPAVDPVLDPTVNPAAAFTVQSPAAPAAPTANPDFPNADTGPDALAEVDATATLLPARTTPPASVALARANDGLPMVLDPFAVASRAVLVLIGSIEPAKHIARTAIEMSIEHDSSAAIDVVIPRAIDLVLRRAAHLVSIGAGPKVVDHYTERLELWRRLARRSGLEPAAIVLTLAPFPIPSVAAMLRVSLAEVEACIDDWYAGIDPDDHRPRSLAPVSAPEQVIDLRDSVRQHDVTPSASMRGRKQGWARFRLRQT